MSSFCKCVPKITIIWCVLPEIWCATDNFLSYWLTFLPFDPTLWKKCKKTWTYYPSYARVPKWRSYDVWLLKYKGTTDSLLTFFALLPKKSIFKKNEKKHLEILSFYTSVSKIMIICYAILFLRYDAWQIVVFYFELFFFPFTLLPLTFRKIKIKKKMWEKNLDMSSFTQVYQKSWSYAILFLRYGAWWMQLLFFTLGYFLPFYTP